MLHPLIKRVAPFARVFTSRGDYLAKTGQEAPPFDYSRPVQDWVDTRKLSGEEEISYEGAGYLRNGSPESVDGRPVLRSFRLFPDQAAAVNLLPDPMPPQALLTPLQLAMVQRKRSWPLALNPGETLAFAPGLPGVLVVDDGKMDLSAPAAGSFTEQDRATLNAIHKIALGLKAVS